jgi:hypothetical protein
MIKQGDKIFNARTGQTIIFRKTTKDTNGTLLEIECLNPKTDALEPVHIHPKQESSCEIISGKLHVWVNGKERIIGTKTLDIQILRRARNSDTYFFKCLVYHFYHITFYPAPGSIIFNPE